MKFCQTSLNFIGDQDPVTLLKYNVSEIRNPLAIISPHAGYIFSGDVASSVFNTINPEKEFDTIFILSTSHTANFYGSSILNDDFYETPYGNMKINKEFYNHRLLESSNNVFNGSQNYFKGDHTIEVILPFIQNRIKYKTIVPIMIGDTNLKVIHIISDVLKKYLNEDNLFVISSDFSHYPSYDEAIRIDNETKDDILKNNSDEFLKNINRNLGYNNLVTRMCGWSAYLTLLYMIENEDIDIEIVKYKNSGDTPYGGKDRVVGYYGINFGKKY